MFLMSLWVRRPFFTLEILLNLELVPPEVRKLIEGLSDEDKKALQEAAKEPDEDKVFIPLIKR